MKRYNHQRHQYGITQEQKLKPLLEAFVGETLTKTRHRYDIMDFVSDSFLVELKSRSLRYHPDDFSTWLLPVCKGEEAKKNKNKTVLFFYHWATTDQIFVLEYNQDLFATFHKEIPEWHLEKQEHYFVPATEFSLVEFIESEYPSACTNSAYDTLEV